MPVEGSNMDRRTSPESTTTRTPWMVKLVSAMFVASTTFRVPSRRLESDEEHRQIVAAIEQHNPDRAEEAARQHIRQAQRTRFENAAVGI